MHRDVVGAGDDKLTTPDAAIYRLALDRFGLQPGEALFIDDVAANVAGARAVGMHAHQFIDASTLRVELEGYGLL